MNNKHRKTLNSIFTNPVSSSIKWKDIETLLIAVGCVVKEGKGSRIRIKKNKIFITFHRPHPYKEALPEAVKSVRAYLEMLGEKP